MKYLKLQTKLWSKREKCSNSFNVSKVYFSVWKLHSLNKCRTFKTFLTVILFVFFQEGEENTHPTALLRKEVQTYLKEWLDYQDGQKILLTTPSVLVGYRLEVYRAEGTTQWYTAVIGSYNPTSKVNLVFFCCQYSCPSTSVCSTWDLKTRSLIPSMACFFWRINDGHYNFSHSSVTANHCINRGQLEKQQVALKETHVEYWW